MKITHLLATAGAFAIAATASFAQVGARPQVYSEVIPPDKGTIEVGLALNAKLDDPSGFTLNARYLPYLNRQLQFGGNLYYINADGGVDGGTLEARLDYNFVPNATEEFAYKRTIPYAGVGLGVAFGDFDGTSWGVHGGVKHFVTNDVSLFGELNWRDFSDGDDDDLRLLIGLATYLRR